MNNPTLKFKSIVAFCINLFFFLFFAAPVFAQIPKQFLDISVVPETNDWTFQIEQNVDFSNNITQSVVLILIENVRFSVMDEKMSLIREGKQAVQRGKAIK